MKKRSSFTLCLALLFCLCSFSGCGEAESLSAEELQEIENCLNSAEYNGFINTYFDSLEEIDLTRAFYDGAGAATFDQTGWSEEEKADVLAATGWETYAGAVLKLTGDAVESVLQERLGVSRGQMADKLSEAMRYVEKYDAYYLMHGDTDYAPVTTVAGRRTGDTYEIEYIPESYTPEYATVTLIKTKTGFRFASNKRTESVHSEKTYAADISFDGAEDLLVLRERTAAAQYCFAYARQTESGRYIQIAGFEEIPNPVPDADAGVILGSRSGDGIVSYSIWRYDSEKVQVSLVRTLCWEEKTAGCGWLREEQYSADGRVETVREQYVPMIGRYDLDISAPEVAAYYAEGSEWSLSDAKWTEGLAEGIKPCRDMGETQGETQEIVSLDGKLYQSYVNSASGLRYIFLSAEEYDMQALWDWIAVGTEKEYSLDLLGKMDEGRK
ncbi:MAG: hypothetical protein IKL89_05530 [Clostridia bacterium]|nr:hypothetical protein [Clostridia bacterium]